MTEPSLAFVSDLARELGATDPVETYYRPLVGRWQELSAEAERLRAAAKTAAGASGGLNDELGRLDASWSGADADAFIAYMGEIRSASEGVEDALDALAAALDELVTSLSGIVHDAEEVLVDAADVLSESAMLPSGGTSRARAQLRETEQSVKSLHEAAEHVLQDFGRLCDGVDAPPGTASSIEVRHRYPQEQFRLHDQDARPAATAGGSEPAAGTLPADPAPHPSHSEPAPRGDQSQPAAASGSGAASAPAGDGVSPSSADDSVSPSATGDSHDGKHSAADPGLEQGQAGAVPVLPEPAAAAAPAAAQGQSGGMAMMPMGGMGGMGGGGGGGGTQHKSKHQTVAKRPELFGEPANVTPPVIGEDPKSAQKPGKKPKTGK